jgi:hypothetical protein
LRQGDAVVGVALSNPPTFALLTRIPDDKRWIDVASDALEFSRLRCVFSDGILVLITDAMVFLLRYEADRSAFSVP